MKCDVMTNIPSLRLRSLPTEIKQPAPRTNTPHTTCSPYRPHSHHGGLPAGTQHSTACSQYWECSGCWGEHYEGTRVPWGHDRHDPASHSSQA